LDQTATLIFLCTVKKIGNNIRIIGLWHSKTISTPSWEHFIVGQAPAKLPLKTLPTTDSLTQAIAGVASERHHASENLSSCPPLCRSGCRLAFYSFNAEDDPAGRRNDSSFGNPPSERQSPARFSRRARSFEIFLGFPLHFLFRHSTRSRRLMA
jgi:hypothetical protein